MPECPECGEWFEREDDEIDVTSDHEVEGICPDCMIEDQDAEDLE